MSNTARRYSDNALLSLLSILTTASQFTGPGKGSKPEQDWKPAFERAIAAVEGLLQRLQLVSTSKAKDARQEGGNLCHLVHAVMAAISMLRKRLHNVATGYCSGAAAGECLVPVG